MSASSTTSAEPTRDGIEGNPLSMRALVVAMDVAITVDDIGRAKTTIRSEVERKGGYVANATSAGSGTDAGASLELRVPTNRASELHAALVQLGEVTSDVEHVDDRTEARADLEARLRNTRVQEKRLLEIMAQKTGSIAEVVAAETELSRVRGVVEQLEAQQRLLEGQIAFATVHVSLQARSTAAWKTPQKSIERAAHLGVQSAAALTVYSAMALATTAPILLPIACAAFAIVSIARKRRKALATG